VVSASSTTHVINLHEQNHNNNKIIQFIKWRALPLPEKNTICVRSFSNLFKAYVSVSFSFLHKHTFLSSFLVGTFLQENWIILYILFCNFLLQPKMCRNYSTHYTTVTQFIQLFSEWWLLGCFYFGVAQQCWNRHYYVLILDGTDSEKTCSFYFIVKYSKNYSKDGIIPFMSSVFVVIFMKGNWKN
jgi:hypothetical protein